MDTILKQSIHTHNTSPSHCVILYYTTAHWVQQITSRNNVEPVHKSKHT